MNTPADAAIERDRDNPNNRLVFDPPAFLPYDDLSRHPVIVGNLDSWVRRSLGVDIVLEPSYLNDAVAADYLRSASFSILFRRAAVGNMKDHLKMRGRRELRGGEELLGAISDLYDDYCGLINNPTDYIKRRIEGDETLPWIIRVTQVHNQFLKLSDLHDKQHFGVHGRLPKLLKYRLASMNALPSKKTKNQLDGVEGLAWYGMTLMNAHKRTDEENLVLSKLSEEDKKSYLILEKVHAFQSYGSNEQDFAKLVVDILHLVEKVLLTEGSKTDLINKYDSLRNELLEAGDDEVSARKIASAILIIERLFIDSGFIYASSESEASQFKNKRETSFPIHQLVTYLGELGCANEQVITEAAEALSASAVAISAEQAAKLIADSPSWRTIKDVPGVTRVKLEIENQLSSDLREDKKTLRDRKVEVSKLVLRLGKAVVDSSNENDKFVSVLSDFMQTMSGLDLNKIGIGDDGLVDFALAVSVLEQQGEFFARKIEELSRQDTTKHPDAKDKIALYQNLLLASEIVVETRTKLATVTD